MMKAIENLEFPENRVDFDTLNFEETVMSKAQHLPELIFQPSNMLWLKV